MGGNAGTYSNQCSLLYAITPFSNRADARLQPDPLDEWQYRLPPFEPQRAQPYRLRLWRTTTGQRWKQFESLMRERTWRRLPHQR